MRLMPIDESGPTCSTVARSKSMRPRAQANHDVRQRRTRRVHRAERRLQRQVADLEALDAQTLRSIGLELRRDAGRAQAAAHGMTCGAREALACRVTGSCGFIQGSL